MRLSFLLLLGLFCGGTLAAQNQCPLPYAEFTHTFGPDGFTVLFESAMGSAECGGEFTFLWTFDDGTTSTEPNPVHIYAEEGTYRVRLKVTLKPPCTGSVTTEHLVTIRGGNPGTLWVDVRGPNLLAECQQVFYEAQVVGGTPPYTYEWDMGGVAVHNYTACGVFTIKLTVSDPSGSMQATRPIIIRDGNCQCAGTGKEKRRLGLL